MAEAHEFIRVLKYRLLVVVIVTLMGTGMAAIWSAKSPEQYVATTRFFISGASAASQYDAQQGGIYARESVISYEQLVNSRSLAQRTIDALGLDMDAKTLADEVASKSTPNSAVIDVSVTADSPQKSKDIANGLAEQFVKLTTELETPPDAAAPVVRITILDSAENGKPTTVLHGFLIYVIGGLLGFIGGVVLAFLLEGYGGRIRDRQDVERASGARPLAELSAASSRALVPLPHPEVREAFQRLWLNLTMRETRSPQVVGITSAPRATSRLRKIFPAAETALNLVASLVAEGKSVVLLVCDRNPQVVQPIFRYRTAHQLGLVDGEELPVRVAFDDDSDASGGAPSDQQAILDSIELMRTEYDYVIALLPPLTEVAAAAAAASEADGVAVVGVYGRNTRRDLDEVLSDINRVQANLLGTVFVRRRHWIALLSPFGGAKPLVSEKSWDAMDGEEYFEEDENESENRPIKSGHHEFVDATMPISFSALHR
jgi:receptor protein-tyrosine kinase